MSRKSNDKRNGKGKVRARQLPGHKRTQRENDIRKVFAKVQKAVDGIESGVADARKELWRGREDEAIAMLSAHVEAARRAVQEFQPLAS